MRLERAALDKFVITGGNRLTGEVTISGAKNAAIAIIPAAILSDGVCRIENIPNITDVSSITRILYDMGAQVRTIDKSTLEIDPRKIHTCVASYELAKHIRGSYYLLGALLGRHIYLDVVSVGATVNIILAAVRAKGMTVIENAAKEPHIVDLANFLNSMGADIRGAGTDVIKIYGVEHLNGTTYSIIPDQIEAGTYMVAAAATSGDVLIKNVIPKHLESITAKLEEMGVELTEYDDSIRVRREGPLNKCNIKTMPHPGFPTDMQPQIAVLLSIANGTSIINESVWDNRFRYIEELKRMGAQISVDGRLAVIEGVDHLSAAPVKATDLRAGAAMIIAALCAQGTSEVEDIQHIERGYENIEEKFRNLGADINRVHIAEPVIARAI